MFRKEKKEMKKQRVRMKEEARKTFRKLGMAKVWIGAVISMAIANAASFPAYADGLTVTDTAIKSMLNSTIDIVFLIFSVGIAVMGAFQLIPAIIHFIQASNRRSLYEKWAGISFFVVFRCWFCCYAYLLYQ